MLKDKGFNKKVVIQTMVKRKERTKESYYGNTPEMINRQRANLSPGNSFAKRKKKREERQAKEVNK